MKRSDIVNDIRTDIRTLRGLLLKLVCHARRQISDLRKDDQVLLHDFHMIFDDAQMMCKNKVKEMHGF
jgi:hypothetical protein